jgi:hypothetical protein
MLSIAGHRRHVQSRDHCISCWAQCAVLILVGAFGAGCRPASWESVASSKPNSKLPLDEINSRQGAFSVITSGKVVKIYEGGRAFELQGQGGTRLLAVVIGPDNATITSRLRLDGYLSVKASVTRRLDDSIYGKLPGVGRQDIRRLAGRPLLQVYDASVLVRDGGREDP